MNDLMERKLFDPLIGQQLGDYEIRDLLGRGGMARVYRGYDARLDRFAAVKVIDTQTLQIHEEQEYRQRFRREARAIAHLSHPNIVGVYQFGEVDNLYYMAMHFIDGRSLGQILREHAQAQTRMPYGQTLRIARDIALALDYAHHHGVIHRDIKPSNIMVEASGRAILTDFGLALSVPEGSIGNTFGSAHYIAPEQALASNNAVPQSDLYSLCVVIYQMLAGKVPFDDPSAMSVVLRHLHEPPPSPSLYNPELGPEIEQALMQGMHKEVNRRYPSGGAMINAIERAMRRVGLDLSCGEGSPNGTYSASDGDGRVQGTIMLPLQPPADPPPSSKPLVRPISVWTPADTAAPTLEAEAVLNAAPKRGRRPWGIAAAALALIAGVVVLSQSSVFDGAGLAVSANKTPADLPVQTATAMPLVAALPTSTAVPSQTPILAPTQRATEAAAEQMIGGGTADFVLRYDGIALALINTSDSDLNLNGIEFAQRMADGSERVFRASQWSNADFSVTDVLPETCVQVWINTFTLLDAPPYCPVRRSWRVVSQPRWFWINAQDETATFEVRRDGQVYAVCAIDAGECAVDLQTSRS